MGDMHFSQGDGEVSFCGAIGISKPRTLNPSPKTPRTRNRCPNPGCAVRNLKPCKGNHNLKVQRSLSSPAYKTYTLHPTR
jgi:hypothetical protein